jgi:hypothetical protein
MCCSRCDDSLAALISKRIHVLFREDILINLIRKGS